MKRQASSAAAGPSPPGGQPGATGPAAGTLQSTASSQRLLGMDAA